MQNLGLVGLVIVVATIGRWAWRAWAVNIPKTSYAFQAAVGMGVGLGALSLYQGHGDPFAAWAIGVGLFFLFLSVTGGQKVGDEMVKVGDSVPVFSAPDDNGSVFDSSNLAGSRILIKFFRGHW
jgi:O-antigen ligase